MGKQVLAQRACALQNGGGRWVLVDAVPDSRGVS
jgi:hypothetical protein